MIQVMPVNDSQEHTEDFSCPCKPIIRLEKDHKEILIHNAFDGRETIN